MNSCVIYVINEFPEDSAFGQALFIYSLQSKILIGTKNKKSLLTICHKAL